MSQVEIDISHMKYYKSRLKISVNTRLIVKDRFRKNSEVMSFMLTVLVIIFFYLTVDLCFSCYMVPLMILIRIIYTVFNIYPGFL